MKQKIVLAKLKVDSLQTLVESRKNHQIKIGRSQTHWIQKRDTYNNIWNAKKMESMDGCSRDENILSENYEHHFVNKSENLDGMDNFPEKYNE